MCGHCQHGLDHHPGPEPHHPDSRAGEEQAEGAVRRALSEVGPPRGGERQHDTAQEAGAEDQGDGEQAGAGEDNQDQNGDDDTETEGGGGEDDEGDG